MVTCKITVISVVLNAAKAFETTAMSVLEQDYPSIEWIVIDGGSTDGTVDVIRKFEKHIHFWSSEPDLGIYDGMNKGLAVASGEWVNFMNAGDSYSDQSTISRLFSQANAEFDVVYGDCIVRYQHVTKYKPAGEPADLVKGMAFCHQAVFAKTTLIKEQGFDITYKIGADYKLLFGLWRSGRKFKHVDIPVTIFDNGGVSNKNMYKSAREHYTIAKKSGRLTPAIWLHHQLFMVWVGLLSIIYRLFPDKLMQSLRSFMIKMTNKPLNQ